MPPSRHRRSRRARPRLGRRAGSTPPAPRRWSSGARPCRSPCGSGRLRWRRRSPGTSTRSRRRRACRGRPPLHPGQSSRTLRSWCQTAAAAMEVAVGAAEGRAAEAEAVVMTAVATHRCRPMEPRGSGCTPRTPRTHSCVSRGWRCHRQGPRSTRHDSFHPPHGSSNRRTAGTRPATPPQTGFRHRPDIRGSKRRQTAAHRRLPTSRGSSRWR